MYIEFVILLLLNFIIWFYLLVRFPPTCKYSLLDILLLFHYFIRFIIITIYYIIWFDWLVIIFYWFIFFMYIEFVILLWLNFIIWFDLLVIIFIIVYYQLLIDYWKWAMTNSGAIVLPTGKVLSIPGRLPDGHRRKRPGHRVVQQLLWPISSLKIARRSYACITKIHKKY